MSFQIPKSINDILSDNKATKEEIRVVTEVLSSHNLKDDLKKKSEARSSSIKPTTREIILPDLGFKSLNIQEEVPITVMEKTKKNKKPEKEEEKEVKEKDQKERREHRDAKENRDRHEKREKSEKREHSQKRRTSREISLSSLLSTPKYTFSLPLSGTYSQYCQPCPIQAYNQNYSGYQGYNQSYSSYQAQRPLTYQPYQQFLENRNCVPCDQYQQPLTGDNYLRSYQPNYYQSTPYQSTAYNTTPYTAPSYQPAPVVQPSYQSYHSHQNYVQPTSYPTNYSSSYQVSPSPYYSSLPVSTSSYYNSSYNYPVQSYNYQERLPLSRRLLETVAGLSNRTFRPIYDNNYAYPQTTPSYYSSYNNTSYPYYYNTQTNYQPTYNQGYQSPYYQPSPVYQSPVANNGLYMIR